MRPLIGITGRRLASGNVRSFDPRFAHLHVDLVWSDNARRIHEAGAIPVVLPFESADAGVVDRLDALLVTGGQDVHPDLWGGDPERASDDADPRQDATVHDRERDVYEIALVRAAVSRRIPVLGICRGNQVLNVALGGTLVEDVPTTGVVHAAAEPPPSAGDADHVVTFVPGSLAHQLFGDSARTNSWHHQAVRDPGPGVTATGHTADGSVEAIELAGAAVLGVQWHPEWHLGLDPVFPWLVESARRRHGSDATTTRV
ncbi:gamma-glutamyl-gamma-aminobutyrate hydrolase family protein [Streptomyces rhizosphaericus]|uniref:Gamma-glutamyl-gamma-aminobutyrate hydrolase family protein n=1 Tax=Streptomyces rhizosphaericus TaxID=114699 RepID=A0A6G4AUZ3_9ACTN|nr:gamma-glutamyl-gamma-aminobutyrate hydrolase family protein [Streptomyces rhizosphaericus]NEW76479.1 gamma-glutamyl-gamma-aminobutyrate hydrolase family protein [Streptomyces rhizosphaericus]